MNTPLEAVKVSRVRDAIGAYCLDCECVIADQSDPYWHWRKSQVMHEKGTGHKTIMFALAGLSSPDVWERR